MIDCPKALDTGAMVGRKNCALPSCSAAVNTNTIILVNNKGDHVIPVAHAKIRGNMMNTVNACLF